MKLLKSLRAQIAIAAVVGGLIAGAAVALAQQVYPLVTQITGNEILQNLGVGTAQYFQTKQIIGAIGFASPHGNVPPVLTSCGTSPTVTGTDIIGAVTMGTGSPTGCVITFSTAFNSAPICEVTWQTNINSMQYTTTKTAITLVQTGTSSNIVNYQCAAQSGG